MKILYNGAWVEIPLTSTKLETPRKISLSTAVESTATAFDGSKDIAIPITKVKEAYLEWGGRNLSSSYAPIDAAMIPTLGANRLAFMPAGCITIQYSRDGGATWHDYPNASDSAKINMVSGNSASFTIGADTSKNIDKTNYKLRIIINSAITSSNGSTTSKCYTNLNKFAIYLSTNGSTGCTVNIEGRTQANFLANNDTWKMFSENVSVGGWSGWNIVNVSGITTYGNQTSQYREIRFTFSVKSHASTVNYPGLTIYKILGFGGVGWSTSSTLAGTGNFFTYDYAQNVTFPAAIKATTFYESNVALSSKYASLSAYNTLIGSDKNKSIRTIAQEEVSKIVGDAPDSFDTLKEIYDWINNHSNSAMQMSNQIQQNITDISNLKTRVGTLEKNYTTLNESITDLTTDFNNYKTNHEAAISNIVDGTTIVGNTALFDGQNAAYYLNYNNLQNKPNLTKFVTLDTVQDISGLKTFLSPANVSGSEQVTIKLKTSNGGAIIFGKEGPNSGTMIRLDQVDGTCRLRFRASATAGAMVWEQPEKGANLFFDLGLKGSDYHRISMPSKAGTLALTSQIPAVYNPKIIINQAGVKKGEFSLNQSGTATINLDDTNTTYSTVTHSANGLMLATDKKKLDGIIIDSSTETWNDVTSSNIPTKGAVAGWTYNMFASKSVATQSANGLMSSADKSHLDSIWSLWGSQADADTLVNKVSEVLAAFENFQEGNTITELLASKQAKGNYISYVLNSKVNIVGNTKDVAKISPQSIFIPNGIIMGGTAAAAGLVTRGICGVTTPDATTGACQKENIYINYDGVNTNTSSVAFKTNRQVVLQAGSIGEHYGHNLYQFCVPRGDIVKEYCDANYASKSSIPTSMSWSDITSKPTTLSEYGITDCKIKVWDEAYGTKDIIIGSNTINIDSRWNSDDLNAIPTIRAMQYFVESKVPTALSQLSNDTDFITSSELPTVNNGKITIYQNYSKIAEFTLNQSSDKTIYLTDTNTTYTKLSQFTNDVGFITSVSWSAIGSKPNTISGFGITDCKIDVQTSQTIITIGGNQVRISFSDTWNATTEDYLATRKTIAKYVLDNFVKKQTATIIFNTSTLICGAPSKGTFTTKTITLIDSVKSGDKVRVYFYGGAGYENYNTGIVEFELFNPASNKLAGSGTSMLTYGAQHFIVNASVSENGVTTSKSLIITVHALDASSYASASQVYVQKVERLR